MPCRIRRRRSAPWAVAALAFAVAGCEERSAAGATDAPSPAAATAHYDHELSRLDGELAQLAAAAREAPATWPPHEHLARALLGRAALTGSFDDHAGAVRAIETAERLGAGAALCATGVRVELAVHRLAAARRRLARCERGGADLELIALRSELELQDGQYPAALRWARAALARRESPADLARLARCHAATGAPIEALALLDRAEKLDHAATPALRAWLALQRGGIALHRGRWDEALAHSLAAERNLAGWWLVDEHIAEARALLGDTAAALALYERTLARAPDPALMDAFAVLLREVGRAAEADAWIGRAAAIHRQRIQQLPEAGAGHAVGHFLSLAPTAPETLALARRQAQLRGAGDARVALARALLAAGRLGEAERAVHAMLATAWRTAEGHAVAYAVLAAAGRATEAQEQAAAATAMNPRWREQYLQRP